MTKTKDVRVFYATYTKPYTQIDMHAHVSEKHKSIF